ncbi:hypothetical protein M408DRAFT_28162 [Serendipita vermifera MAFF 305830]|uniref:Uncharacterized protein n=1 Tax=Serendipita vermifera MAFF 305830 TaxID=933852 RepID=A0A0C2X0Z3_SERVB|nr:hypothetical protein M408DRAFT_28162 [Serendipita vermifera MAFF 305830]
MELGLLIPGLVDDVVGEIFHQFIAVDWEGPFLLMLVSKGWRDLVLSRPSFWIWIKIDDLQTDWSEKVIIGQALSRGLLLQVVVRIPFTHFDDISELLSRCGSIILDTSTHTRIHTGESGPVTQELFDQREGYYQDVHKEIVQTLSALSLLDLPIYMESLDGASFAYSTWTISERVRKEKTLKDQFQDMPLPLITRLVLRNKDKPKPQRIKISTIWPYLPSMPFLKELEISDNFMGVDRVSDIDYITLESLQRLEIDCPTHWLSKAPFKGDPQISLSKNGLRVGLFGLLHRLQAPLLHTLSLIGYPNEIIDTLTSVQGFCILTLEVSLLRLQELVPQLLLGQGNSWHPLCNYMIKIAQIPKNSPLEPVLGVLLSFAPGGCQLRLIGDHRLKGYIKSIKSTIDVIKYSRQSAMGIEAYEVQYQVPLSHTQGQTFPSEYMLDVTCIEMEEAPLDDYDLWKSTPERLVLTGGSYAGMEVQLCEMIHAGTLTSLDIGDSFEAGSVIVWSHIEFRLTALTSLRCITDDFLVLAVPLVMPQLADLTLTRPKNLPDPRSLQPLISQRGCFAKLVTLRFEEFPSPWSSVFEYIIAFRALGTDGGVTTIELPGQPHTSIVSQLVQVLGNELEEFDVGQAPQVNGPPGCVACLRSGWNCFNATTCTRFLASQKVSITKDTYVPESD